MELAVVIPFLAMEWCLEDCLESFGESDVPILVVDNSLDGSRAFDQTYHLRTRLSNLNVKWVVGNIGIAGAWNEGLALGADQTLICSQFVRLAPAEFPRRVGLWGLDHVAQGIRKNANEYGCTFDEQGFHFISIGRTLVDTIGTFDENFLYGEDDDFRHRMVLAGDLKMGALNGSGVFSIGYGIQKRAGTVQPGWHRIRSYWRHKWGSDGGGIINYTTPFGNPDYPLSYWPAVR